MTRTMHGVFGGTDYCGVFKKPVTRLSDLLLDHADRLPKKRRSWWRAAEYDSSIMIDRWKIGQSIMSSKYCFCKLPGKSEGLFSGSEVVEESIHVRVSFLGAFCQAAHNDAFEAW